MTPLRRVRLTFAVLIAAAVVAVGIFGRVLALPSSPAAGLAAAGSGLAAAVAGGLAVRILVVTDPRPLTPRAVAPPGGCGRSARATRGRP